MFMLINAKGPTIRMLWLVEQFRGSSLEPTSQ
jgi:hypothetical protein